MNSRSRVEVSVEIFTADWAALFLQIELDQTDFELDQENLIKLKISTWIEMNQIDQIQLNLIEIILITQSN